MMTRHSVIFCGRLLKSKIATPELASYGITMGGEDEAWLYRDAARDTWLKHKGAIS